MSRTYRNTPYLREGNTTLGRVAQKREALRQELLASLDDDSLNLTIEAIYGRVSLVGNKALSTASLKASHNYGWKG